MSIIKFAVVIVGLLASMYGAQSVHAQVTNPQTGSVGLSGTVPKDPPSTGATISFPSNGQVFTEIPITVQGICPVDTLVKIFKNDVFAGSVPCNNGAFQIDIDLFSGRNQLVARVFDSLDQAGPDSNTVTVEYRDPTANTEDIEQLVITSNFALRGADAGKLLKWPLALSGGVRPYAITVDWGDGEESQLALDLAGNFVIEHTYFEPGVYRVIVKATDSRGKTAFIQLIAVANGPSSVENGGIFGGAPTDGTTPTSATTGIRASFTVPLLPIYIMFFFVISTFWIGRRYEMRRIKNLVRKGKAVQL